MSKTKDNLVWSRFNQFNQKEISFDFFNFIGCLKLKACSVKQNELNKYIKTYIYLIHEIKKKTEDLKYEAKNDEDAV